MEADILGQVYPRGYFHFWISGYNLADDYPVDLGSIGVLGFHIPLVFDDLGYWVEMG
ncbi:MAG: hypothetical protein MUC59_02095 [Saprospiraceae bacterium]|nr:hypothetical protein [Saprospiraceae bacterium]